MAVSGIKFAALCAALAGLSACGPLFTNPQPPDYVALSKVIDRVKLEVADYTASEPYLLAQVNQNKDLACSGDVRFNITEIDLNLITTSDVENEGKIGLAIPVGPTGATIKPSIDGTSGRKSVLTTKVGFYPLPGEQPDPPPLPDTLTEKDLVLSRALQQLRLGMLRSAAHGPCFTVRPSGDAKPDDSIAGQLVITKKVSSGLDFDYLILSAGLSKNETASQDNTITVKYGPEPLPKQPAAPKGNAHAGNGHDRFITKVTIPNLTPTNEGCLLTRGSGHSNFVLPEKC